MNIFLTNTLAGVKQLFVPRIPSRVSMYVCGVTPYADSHVGHGRVYVSFDVLYRLLQYAGYTVAYCRNFTDVDDKIIRKAEQEFGNQLRFFEISQRYIKSYHEDMQALNCLSPDYEPKVTEHIDDIIAFIQRLIDANVAYSVAGDVYFNIHHFATYGALSKHKLEDLRAGARVEPNEKKRDPLDFALWKSEPTGLFWTSPWGHGRPGWHIECSALAERYLGAHIDIHAGGLDLVFPHHENEKAQSEALSHLPFVNYWVHNGFVRVNEEKMSKSLGNFFTLRDVFKHVHPMVVRYYILMHHYRAPLEFSFEGLQAAEKSYRKLCRAFADVKAEEQVTLTSQQASTVVLPMLEFLADDLNTPGMLGVLHGIIATFTDPAHDVQARAVKGFLIDVMGLSLEPLPEATPEITDAMRLLIEEREQARMAKDWARADALRDKLLALGVQIRDKKKDDNHYV